MAKRKTNEQIVRNMMNYSAYGALAQLFIINAIHAAAEATVEAGVSAIPEGDMIDPKAWFGVAQEIKNKLEENWRT